MIQKKFPFLLLGNKSDKNDQRQVDKQKADVYSKEHHMFFYETSALDGTNVEIAMKTISASASEMDTVPYFSPEINDRINLEDIEDTQTPTSSSCFC